MNFHPNRLPLALASPREPFAHSLGQSSRGNSQSRFDLAVANWERVVKFGRSGEIAHAKAIEPSERAGTPLAGSDNLDEKFLRVDGCEYIIVISATRALPQWHHGDSLVHIA